MKSIGTYLEEFNKTLPKFSDGRIDYSSSKIAPVITVFVVASGSLLILKRSDEVGNYKGKWNAISGYLDELRPIREKVLEELHEEVGIDLQMIESLEFGEVYELPDEDIDKTWIIQPVLVGLNTKPDLKIDWEHTEYKWINPEDLVKHDCISGLDLSFKKISKVL